MQSEMGEQVRAAVLVGPREIELREFPRPDLPAGAVLLKTSLSEVCGTDVHLWHGRLAGVPYPIIPGHVSIGIADKVRGDVRPTVCGRLCPFGRRNGVKVTTV